MRFIPTPIVLSEASDPPLICKKGLILQRNSLKWTSWRENPVVPRLVSLSERICVTRQLPKMIRNLPLLTYMQTLLDLNSGGDKPKRPGYFDQLWSNVSCDLLDRINLELGFEIRRAINPEGASRSYIVESYPELVVIHVDGSFRLSSDRAGMELLIEELNYRHGRDPIG